MKKRLGVAVLVLFGGSPLLGGEFRVRNVWYDVTKNPGSWLVIVNAEAEYVGSWDSNDNHALLQTVAWDTLTQEANGGGNGINVSGPFLDGQVITCQGSCSGRKYVPKPQCGDTTPMRYKGYGAVTIYHQYNPEIDKQWGTENEVTECYDNGQSGGGTGGTDPADDENGGFGPGSPILIDLDRDGYHLSGTDPAVRFDLDGDGVKEAISWTRAGEGDAFLCLDRNGNGTIDSGLELFGNHTRMVSGAPTANGYLALAELDMPELGGNLDGVIRPGDAVYERLWVWTDGNRDGESQPHEIQTLAAASIRAVEYGYVTSRRRDRHGNEFRFKSKAWVLNRAGLPRAVSNCDVFFVAGEG